MKTILSFGITLFLIACSTSKNLSFNETELLKFSNQNDTIFYNSKPAAIMIHSGWVYDKNKVKPQMVIKEIEFSEDLTLSVLNYVHYKHPKHSIEIRYK
jgi:hypothetical protein